MNITLMEIILGVNFIGLLANAISVMVIFGETDFFKYRHHYEKMILVILLYLGIENTVYSLFPIIGTVNYILVVVRSFISVMVLIFAVVKYRSVSILTDKNNDTNQFISTNILSSLTENIIFAEIIPYLVMVTDEDGKVIYSNEKAKLLLQEHIDEVDIYIEELKFNHEARDLIRQANADVIKTNDAVYVENIPFTLLSGAETTLEVMKFPYTLDDDRKGVLSLYQNAAHRQSDYLNKAWSSDFLLNIDLDEGQILIDFSSSHVYVNEKWANWLGVASNETKLDARVWKECFDKRDYIGYESQLHYHIKKYSTPFSLEFRMHDRTNKSKWVSFKGKVIDRDDHGNAVSVVGRVVDIDADKSVEIDSVLNNRIINSGNVSFVLAAADGEILRTNDAFARLIGSNKEEMIGLPIYDYHYNYAGDGFENIWYDLKINRSITFETVYRNEQFEPIPVEINATYLEISGNEYASIFISSIDERMKMLEQIQKGNEKLRLTMEGINDVMVEIDFTEKHIDLNDIGYEILGLVEDEIDLYVSWKELVHPEDEHRLYDVLSKQRNKCSTMSVQVRLKVLDDHWKWFEICGKFFMPDKLGVCSKFFGLIRDIHEQVEMRKQLEEGLRMLQEAEAVAKMGHFSYDLERNIVIRNQTTLELLNMTNQQEEVSYEAFTDEIHEDDRKYVDYKILDAIWNRTHFDIVYRMNDADGITKFINARAKAVYDENLRPQIMMGTLIDVTEQKEREKAIYKSRYTFESVVANSPLGMLVIELPSMKIVTQNSKVEEFLSIDRSMDLATKWKKLDEILVYNASGETTFNQMVNDFVDSKQEYELSEIDIETQMGRLSTEVYLDIIESKDHDISNLLVISINDISRIVNVTSELKAEKERLLTAEAMTKVGNWSFSKEALHLSDGFKEILAIDSDAYIGNDFMRDVYTKVVADEYVHVVSKLPSEEQPIITLEYEVLVNGERKKIEEIRKLHDGNYYGVIKDVTKTRALIHQLQDSKRDMLALINSIDEDVIYYDHNLDVILSNRDVTLIKGKKTCTECEHLESDECLHCIAKRALVEGKVVSKVEENHHHRMMKYTASPVFGGNHEIVGVVETRLDITNSIKNLSTHPMAGKLGVERTFVSNLMNHCKDMCESKEKNKDEVMDHTMGRLSLFTGNFDANPRDYSCLDVMNSLEKYLDQQYNLPLGINVDVHRLEDVKIHVDISKLKYIADELIKNARRESDNISVKFVNRNGYNFDENMLWGTLKKVEYVGITVENEGVFDEDILPHAIYPFISGYPETEGLGLSEVLGIALSYDGLLSIRSKDNFSSVGVYISLEGELNLPITAKYQQILQAIEMHMPVKQLPEYAEVTEWLQIHLNPDAYKALQEALNQYDYDVALAILKEINYGEKENTISRG